MPFYRSRRYYPRRTRRSTRPTSYRRRYSKRFNRYRKKYPMYAGPTSQTKFARLKYADAIVTDLTSITPIGYFNIRANGIYDPNYSGVGHQPLGHDQWQAFYNHYCVLASYIRVRWVPHATEAQSQAISFVCGIYVDDDFSAPANYLNLLEQGRSYSKVTNDTADYATTVKAKFNLRKFFHCRAPLSDDRFVTAFGSSPAEQAGFTCWIAATDSASDVHPIHAVVEVIYYCAFLEPRTLNQS